MADFPAALPHGSFTEIFPNIFMVTGSFRMGPGVSIPRNMTVVRQGDELSLINSVRLTPEGEAELAKLGKVKHLLRIGAFHGADDPYYVDRYKPVLWAPPRTRHQSPDLKTDQELVPGQSPIAGATVFAFDQAKRAEVALVLDHDGGVLVTCDAFQHWATFEGVSPMGKVVMTFMGFGPTIIGGPWMKAMGPDVRKDFDRLAGVEFRHLIPGHGAVLRAEAKPGLHTAMKKRFGG